MQPTATYSPQDDKLRVYFATRQGDDVLEPLRKAGFRWAGAQECWFAHWTPEREDACFAVGVDDIDDEASTLEERAEARAERFDGYTESAQKESEALWNRDRAVLDAMNGQPVLVGHHSEKRHRRELRRLDDHMRKRIELGKRASYWEQRAAGAVSWARHKESPDVRARRIKGLEADARRVEKRRKGYALVLEHFTEDAPFTRLIALANNGSATGVPYGVWGKLDKLREAPEANRDAVLAIVRETRDDVARWDARQARWTDHLAGRIAYERAQLDEQGAAHLLEKKPRPKQPPLLNLKAGGHAMTAAEYAAIWRDYKGTRLIGTGSLSYRVRVAMVTNERGGRSLCRVFLSDKREDAIPEGADAPEQKERAC